LHCLQAGLTALHYAAWQGSVDAVELLLEKGCNVNAADPVSADPRQQLIGAAALATVRA
jgi:ankyrin repeat protein